MQAACCVCVVVLGSRRDILGAVARPRGNDFSTGWSRPTFSSWGSGGAVRPQRILTTIFGKLTENQVSGSTAGYAVLTEAVINLVDIHDRLVTSLVYCAISHFSLVVVVDFLYCLVCLREILLHKQNQNMEEIQGGHCPCSKIQGGQPTTLPPPCRAPDSVWFGVLSSCALGEQTEYRLAIGADRGLNTSRMRRHGRWYRSRCYSFQRRYASSR